MLQPTRQKIFLPIVPKRSWTSVDAFSADRTRWKTTTCSWDIQRTDVDGLLFGSILKTHHLRYTWDAHVSTWASRDSSTSRSTASSSRQPISYDNRQSRLQEQCDLGISPTLHWSWGKCTERRHANLRLCTLALFVTVPKGFCPC